jgi:hypothetical protein
MKPDVVTWWREGHPLVSRWTHTEDWSELTWVGHAANAYHRHTRWVRFSWWRYVFESRDRGNKTPFLRVAWCRIKGHPRGEVYFNAGGYEPDHRCKDCSEVIG